MAHQLIDGLKRCVSSFLIFIFTLIQVIPPGPIMAVARAADSSVSLTMGGYSLVKITEAGRWVFDFPFKASVTNNSTQKLKNVTATLSANPRVTIVDNSLSFGDVGAKTTLSRAQMSLF